MTSALELGGASVSLPDVRDGLGATRERILGGARLGDLLLVLDLGDEPAWEGEPDETVSAAATLDATQAPEASVLDLLGEEPLPLDEIVPAEQAEPPAEEAAQTLAQAPAEERAEVVPDGEGRLRRDWDMAAHRFDQLPDVDMNRHHRAGSCFRALDGSAGIPHRPESRSATRYRRGRQNGDPGWRRLELIRGRIVWCC